MAPPVIEVRMMTPVNFFRLSDDLYETSSAFADPEGNVTISVAEYKTLMTDAGWVLKAAVR